MTVGAVGWRLPPDPSDYASRTMERGAHEGAAGGSAPAADPGQLREAIDLLTAIVAGRPAPDVERALVWLRHRLGEVLRTRGDRPADRPRWPDPFPEVRGRPPEVGPNELDPAVLGGAIQHHGCLLVRGLVDASGTAELAQGLERAFAHRDRAGEAAAPTPWYARYAGDGPPGSLALARSMVAQAGGVWAADSPRMLAALLAHLEAVGLIEVITAHLGERPALSIEKTTLRRVPPETYPSWHQDGAFMGAGLRTVNVWLALSDCGEGTDAPGLVLVPRRIDEVVEVGTEGAVLHNAVGPRLVERLAGTDAPIQRPRFRAGDALVFDEVFLHASGTEPGQTRDRLAIEAWFFVPADVPADYQALAV